MKLTTKLSLGAALAALISCAPPVTAGILTVTSGPTFTPDTAFTDNTIVADTTVEGGLIHLVGGATITPPSNDVVTIDVSGTYSANAGEKFSVAYSFSADLNIDTPSSYSILGSVVVGGQTIPIATSGTLMPGLHRYEGTVASEPLQIPVSGTFDASLTLNFNTTANTAVTAAAPGTLVMNIQQIDFKLDTAVATVQGPALPQNLSTRGNVGTGDNVLIGGFIIFGSDGKKVVLRAIGPSLSPPDVTTPLQDPVLELHDSSGNLIASNDNWKDLSADDQATLTGNNLAPTNDAESALVMNLSAGTTYTAIVRGANNTTGVALVEIYDIDGGTTNSTLANISTRGNVGTGEDVLIGGFVVGGGAGGLTDMIIRGIGPSLAADGIADPLADPVLELHDADGNVIDTNDNWMDNPNMQTISDDGLAPTDPNESALFEILQPGVYTAILTGANDGTGIGLVEVYDIDANP